MGILTIIIEAASFGGTVGALVAETIGASATVGTLTGMAVGGTVGAAVGVVEECSQNTSLA